MARTTDATTELRRGALELALLAHLARGAAFGGGLASELSSATDGALDVTEGALYPALHRLEKRGVLGSEWVHPEGGGRRRRYYHLTAAGEARLVELTTAWQQLAAGVDRLLEEG